MSRLYLVPRIMKHLTRDWTRLFHLHHNTQSLSRCRRTLHTQARKSANKQRSWRTAYMMDQRIHHYSTSSQDLLSLDNPSVQKYLNSLKAKYESALEMGNVTSMKFVSTVRPIMDIIEEVEAIQGDVQELRTLAEEDNSDKEMRDLAQKDLHDIQETLTALQDQLFEVLVPEEPIDNTNVVLEVSAGVGGQEAMLFSQEVFNMYQGFAEYMGWTSDLTDYETTDLGGLRHGAAVISGDSVYQALKYEGGIHRVQRVPKTEKAGRIHTSTVSVAVLPQPSEIEVQILDKDLKIDTKRASGAGGQHVNTTDSAVRITHLPSGLVVECQEERSQHHNRNTCLKKLRAQLYQQQLDHITSSYTSNRKLQVGTRARSEKIRTYNYPQDRVTDHRIGLSVHNLPSFLSGTELLHSFICQVLEEARKEKLQELLSSRGEMMTPPK
ncbi:hypothetical protein Pcinc_017927 [Petrolisthes cinctipes]|uniref:Prokaryotic-type class I peptide chain release factors domain-containing protein n=1 Tax=Petrolisthes cinctipes TaxID=88211 RepID=A0AAE1FT93_PETCI|nr:hypothetical protein Pcinc_017927 [Petrolisthes cinctipes]